LASVQSITHASSLLIATSHLEGTGDHRVSKIAFQGFEDQEHWVVALRSSPYLFAKHKYQEIPINLDEKVTTVWLFKRDLQDKFTTTAAEVCFVLRHFPSLLAIKLHEVTSFCSHQGPQTEEIKAMIEIANQHKNKENPVCITGLARTIVAGRGQSFILLNDYLEKEDKVIGTGVTKSVTFAVGMENGMLYANGTSCKKDLDDDLHWQSVINEARVLHDLKNCRGVLQLALAIEHEDQFSLITEYYNEGDLQKVFDKKIPFSLAAKIRLAADMAQGLLEVHQRNILHRDLKPSNILIEIEKGKARAVIGDFGSACKLDDPVFQPMRTGTLAYMAPEKIHSLSEKDELIQEWCERSTPAADIWSLGLIFFSLFHPIPGMLMDFQKAPDLLDCNRDRNTLTIQDRLKTLLDDEILLELGILPESLVPILQRMLRIAPEERFSAKEVYSRLIDFCTPQSPRTPRGGRSSDDMKATSPRYYSSRRLSDETSTKS
jgi:hypothetical protein